MLKIQEGVSFETVEHLYQTTLRHNPVDINFQNHLEVKLISR